MTVSRRLHGWRKLATASWSSPHDPQFYGDLEIDAASMLSYLNVVRDRTGVHATVTHAVVRAIAHALDTVPQLNIRLAHGREYERSSIDVFVIVAAGDSELTGVKVREVNRKSLADVANEIEARAGAIRAGTDVEFGRTKRMLTVLPLRALRRGLRLAAWLTSDLGLDAPKLGLPREAFGSAMVTSIGMTGISHAYSPLAPYYRVPFLVLVGAVTEKPVVRSGQIIARPILTLTATFDHRYVDGLQAASFAHAAQAYLANPAAFEPPLDAPIRLPDQRVQMPAQDAVFG
jgi:pyruvate/2-oxoglutarate dehydrogenase complex dihydrolipoamide acyltransferase (E2) component